MDEAQIYARLVTIFHDVFDEDSIQVTPRLAAKDVPISAAKKTNRYILNRIVEGTRCQFVFK
jgi:hypothetical protein